MAQRAYIVTDISFGDAGKGTTVDFLARQASSAVVIRHNGGAQAAHNVVTPEGFHHTFAQFGSGSFVPGTRTHLSRFMVLNPLNMLYEGSYLERLVPDIWQRVSVDREALVTTPWQQAANQLRELARGAERHGSCGLGVGETVSDSLVASDLAVQVKHLVAPDIAQRLMALRDAKLQQLRNELGDSVSCPDAWSPFYGSQQITDLVAAYREWATKVAVVDASFLEKLAARHELLVFEGAQGVLLDEWYGFHPYTTWSTTTHANALELLNEIDFREQVTRLGVLRAYTTRHGAGPFVTEDKHLAQALPDYHNGTGRWQGNFRVGHLDLVAHRYALDVCRDTDGLVVTGLDRVAAAGQPVICTGYVPSKDDCAAGRFELDSAGIATRIIPGAKGDLERQARLTTALQACSPKYQEVRTSSSTPEAYTDSLLQTIEEHLGVPVALSSFGPTWADKR